MAGLLRAEPPKTAAEASDYQRTSTYAEVTAFCDELAKQSPRVRLSTLGTSQEGRKLPLVIVADPPVATAAEAASSRKLVVFALANIHAGEVDGKEALLMLARDLALAPDKALLENLVIVLAPIFNADGNEKFGPHRPAQAGPTQVGTRENAAGLDLNRDFVKLESPEARALVKFIGAWNPAVTIDCHTTNGSHHRYTLTYEGGRHPAGDPRIAQFTREKLLPQAGRLLKEKTGFESYFYGNFAADHTRWETILPLARYGTHYIGLRNRIAVLSESYSYAPFKDRVRASQEFVRGVLQAASENRTEIRRLLAQPESAARIPLQYKAAPLGEPADIPGFALEEKDGRRVATTTPRDYKAQYLGGTESTLVVARPFAYLLPASLTKVVENLQRHGLTVEELREDLDLEIEAYRIDRVSRGRAFQRHELVELEATVRKETRRIAAGTVLVKTAQPLGSLAATLLEPQSADGLATWNFLDEQLKEGGEFPILRLPAAAVMTAGRVRLLAEDRTFNKPITYDAVYGGGFGRGLSFGGSPASIQAWLDDGEHFLQQKEGQLYRVEARTGKASKYIDEDALARGLAKLPAMSQQAAQGLSRGAWQRLTPQRDAALFNHQGDLYYCKLDGSGAVRLTRTPAAEELASFSPDGKLVAFVQANNLFVVDVATQTVRPLTTDGSATITSGKADWVYYEEIFNRDYRCYWWSADSSRIAFLRLDDGPVRNFTIVDQSSARPEPEVTPYPKAGAPNPLASLGLVAVAGGEPQFVDLSNYTPTASLVIRAGWLPDSQTAYFYVQDRAQTWLDFCTAAPGGETKCLFRETTKAWVNDPGPPHFLKDGSFLLTSERDGWRHYYHFAADGKLIRPLTSGEWEARTLHTVDEAGGWVYFSGTRDSHLGANLYHVKLDGTQLERLTAGGGTHTCSVSPKSNLFVDVWSDHQTPTQVRLCESDGKLARTLDTNPVHSLEEYRRGSYRLVQIPTSDGYTIEASLLVPPDFDSTRTYPVWFTTYGGPHAPTIGDSWAGGRVRDEMLAQLGFVVFKADPRSASGKGECSTWTAYRRLGVQELKDVETAIGWLKQQPGIDGERIGMSGHSYGGFLTAYCLTHSKLFAAGIAGAPVTDWRSYDSIYTERYMNTPQENPQGYSDTSVVRAARNLHGKLLILHGLIDDNVHVQNSLQLIDALQRADKDFEVMFYPKARHGIGGAHYNRLQVEFMKRALKVAP